MAKKKKKSSSRKKPSITKPLSKEETAARRRVNKPLLARFRKELDLELLIADGIPDNENRTEAYQKIYDEGVSLTWVAEVLTEVTGNTVTARQVIAILRRTSVSMITLKPEDEFDASGPWILPVFPHRWLGQTIYTVGYPRKTKPDSDTFIHPKDMAVLEGMSRFSKVTKHREWLNLKKARSHIS